MIAKIDTAKTMAPRPIREVARGLDLHEEDIELHGKSIAKISWPTLSHHIKFTERVSKLVLVTAISPTNTGEGKTTVAIGLTQALNLLGEKAVAVLREPSLGPVFGKKGGATGGGLSKLYPSEEINLHFTGDLHAVSAANNLLAAAIDNHVYHGNELEIDEAHIFHKRAIDINDRALRQIISGLGGKENGNQRETGFDITAASEIMAILCLSNSIHDLEKRIGNMVVATNMSGAPVKVSDLKAQGAITALLSQALKPNLVQTIDGAPVFVHGGPFANIAHGCSSLLSLRLALSLSDIVITEAGFGSDLGFEKYCDIVASQSPSLLAPDVVLIVASIKALKHHGGVEHDLSKADAGAVKRGLANLDSHIKIVSQSGLPFIVTLNRFPSDQDSEIAVVEDYCLENGWNFSVIDSFRQGAEGGLALAETVIKSFDEVSCFEPFYELNAPLLDKLKAIATKVYGVETVQLGARALQQFSWLEENGFQNLPVCIAKSQYSLSGTTGNAASELTINDLRLSAGAGFVVAIAGKVTTMPGLPKHPALLEVAVNEDGVITGLL